LTSLGVALWRCHHTEEHHESTYEWGAIAVLSCAALGTTAINVLYAQNKSPGAYVIIDISEVTNPDGFKQLFPKAPPAVAAFDGHFVTRTEKITALDGTPPKRFVIIGFDSVEKAKA
jgi:uncharacterized protein (DUF1330 family)